MTELKITEPEQVRDIKKLQGYLVKRLGPGGRNWCPIPVSLLEDIHKGELRKYRLTTDARARFLCGETDFFSLDYNLGRYRLKILVLDDRVQIDSLDRQTMRPIERHAALFEIAQ